MLRNFHLHLISSTSHLKNKSSQSHVFLQHHQKTFFFIYNTITELGRKLLYLLSPGNIFPTVSWIHSNKAFTSTILPAQVALVVKNSPANAADIRDVGSIPGSGRFHGEEYSNPLQHSCLENPLGRGAWRATVHRFAKSRTWLKQFSTHACTLYHFTETTL